MSPPIPLVQYETLIVFDVETTGLNCQQDRIIEFGAVKHSRKENGSDMLEELDILIRLADRRSLPPEIAGLTGITDELLREEGISEVQAAAQIVEMISSPNTLLVAYNAQFDLCFLYWLLHRNDLEGCLKQVMLLDALTVYRDRRPYPHRLSDAIAAYGIAVDNTHRALDDAKATWELLCCMQEEEDELERYVNLFGYHPKYGISGPRISSVTYRPQGYDSARKLYELS